MTPEQVQQQIECCKVGPAASVRGGWGRVRTAPGPALAGPGCELECLGFSWSRSGGEGGMPWLRDRVPRSGALHGEQLPSFPKELRVLGLESRGGGGGCKVCRISSSDGTSHRNFVVLWRKSM